jgi:hypothetical protein
LVAKSGTFIEYCYITRNRMQNQKIKTQLPVELLECEQMYGDVHCHRGALWTHRMSAFHVSFTSMALRCFVRVSQYTSDDIVGSLLEELNNSAFLSQKTVLNRFLADVCSKFSACLLNVCASTALTLVPTFTNETQVLSSVTSTTCLRNSSPCLWHR